jgi:molybdenum cofactor biosynthesis enzyme MoaA
MKKISTTTICPAVWDHLCINTNGKNRLCCNSYTQPNDTFLDNFDNHWIEYRDNIKEEMLKGNKPKECNSCWKKEELGISSLRQGFIHKYEQRGEWDNFINSVHETKQYPTQLDLKLGNFCNLSCRMCSSYSSSKYASEFKKIIKDTGVDYGINEHEKNYVQNDWYDTEQFFQEFANMVDHGLQDIKFTGGEPLIVPNVSKILNYCFDNDKAKDMNLTVITNATKINTSWIDTFLKFMHTNVIVSIDGVEDIYEYIRYPADWNDVYNKLKLLSEHTQWKLTGTLTFTLQIYNMLQAEKMIELKRELGFNINAIPLDTPSYLDVRNAPAALKEDALKIVNKVTPIDEQEKSFLTTFKNTIMQPALDDATLLQEKFVEISLLKDPYRKQDLTKTEIWKYYEMLCNNK